MKRNWFETLNAALDSEGLTDTWDCFNSIGYNEYFRYFANGECIVIYRDDRGMYERPVHYASKMS